MAKDKRRKERESLIRIIEEEVRQTESYTGRSHLDLRVLNAMEEVPRERFVPEYEVDSAYANVPLPIGYRQTISQPYIVALMTDLLETRPSDIVLEVGTGSGYQAAVLSLLVDRVYTVEVIPELADRARQTLSELGYGNVVVRQSDGNLGWPEHGPYDGIIVTAGAEEVPDALVDQLKPGGRLAIPVNANAHQVLKLIRKDRGGALHVQDILPVAFVPLIRPGVD